MALLLFLLTACLPLHSHHLDLVVAAGLEFSRNLERFSCEDDSTGYGSLHSEAAVISLAETCPNLWHVDLNSACRLTDDSHLAFLKHCPNLHTPRHVAMTEPMGKSKARRLWRNSGKQGLSERIGTLDLVDQSLDRKVRKALSSIRKELAITDDYPSEKPYDFGSIRTWRGGQLEKTRSSGYVGDIGRLRGLVLVMRFGQCCPRSVLLMTRL